MTPENNESSKWERTKYPICNPLVKPIDPEIQRQVFSAGPKLLGVGFFDIVKRDIKNVFKIGH